MTERFTMADVMLVRGVPEHIRSDNGAEMTAKIVRNWLAQVGAKTLYIEPGSPWEKWLLRILQPQATRSMFEPGDLLQPERSKVVIGQWRHHYNTIRPHSSLNYRPPAPPTFVPLLLPLDGITSKR